MAPKSPKRSPSVKKSKSGALSASESSLTLTDGEASQELKSKSKKEREKEKEKEAEERAKRWQEASAPKPYVPYDGPRPDEEFLQAVRLELEEGKRAKEAIEQVYAMHRTGYDHRLQDEEVIGPERLLTVDVNQRSITGYTSILMATAAGNAEIVALLLERRADVSIRSVNKAELPIHFAAMGGYDVVMRLLVEPTKAKGLIDAVNVTGWSALHLSLVGHHMTVMIMLIRAGANINGRNQFLGGCTALHVAARMGFQDGMESLLDRDADVRATDNLEQTALHFCARRADAKGVSLLLRTRADPTSCGSGVGMRAPLELVPVEHPSRDKVVTLLQAYSRPPPPPVRADARFDQTDRPSGHVA